MKEKNRETIDVECRALFVNEDPLMAEDVVGRAVRYSDFSVAFEQSARKEMQ